MAARTLFDESENEPEEEPRSPDDENPLVHRKAPETSREAADSVRASIAAQRGIVYDAYLSCGRRGSTDQEMEGLTGLSGDAIRPRRIELCGRNKKAGLPCLVIDSGTRRPTRSGRSAAVWVALACLDEVADAR